LSPWLFSVSRFDDECCGETVAVDQRLQSRRIHPASGDGAHDLGAAEHRHRLQLDGKTVGLAVEVGIVETDDLAWRILTCGDEGRELGCALGDEPGVRSIEQNGRGAGTRRLQERFGLMGLYGDHGLCGML